MRWLGVVLTLLFVTTAGCSRSAITVDGEEISKEFFDNALKERLNAHKSMNVTASEKALRKSVSEELIAEALLLEEAKSRKIAVTDDEIKKTIDGMRGSKDEKDFKEDLRKSGTTYDIFLKKLRNRLILSKLMGDLVKDDSISEEAMREYYKASQVPLLKPEKDFVKIVQLSSEADAKEAAAALKKREDFDALADRLVKSGKASATDYGWLEPDVLSKEIAMAMKAAKLNIAHGPYKGKDGSYYLFRLKERKGSEVLPFDEARPQIKNILLSQKRQEIAAKIVETRRKTAKIKVNIVVG